MTLSVNHEIVIMPHICLFKLESNMEYSNIQVRNVLLFMTF